ncbi:MAG TPA: alginate lyase family protein [Planctomycetaceae bacterium]|nr:alginate lyase family protein [Planctomycetaceae bacterium]
MALDDLPRLIRTIRHLRPSQIYWRGRYTVQRRARRAWGARSGPAISLNGSVPRLRDDFPTDAILFDDTPLDPTLVAQLSAGQFVHLNTLRDLGRPPDWLFGKIDHDRLWTVTLHYHRWAYDLARLAAANDSTAEEAGRLFVEFVSDWIGRSDLAAAGAAELAWNAYATATRIGWWIRAAVLLGAEWWSNRGDFDRSFLSSLWRQAEYLAGNIEWDLRGNHLLRDAVGLAFAGRFFDGPHAKKWLCAATDLAQSQLVEQVLDDGGHFERTPLYHLKVMEDFFALSRLIEDEGVRHSLESTVLRMAEFLRWVRHPDGDILLFNDAALDDEMPPDAMFRLLEQSGHSIDATLPQGGRHFAQTGLAVWHGSPWSVFIDVGLIGPDYQPGHGHADSLTLECSFDGERLFVDPGTHSYDRDERRAYDRSTAAHNTICVDGTDSSEVWHIFRVGRRARARDVDVRIEQDGFDASAAHDGYAHLAGVIHRRQVQLAEGGRRLLIIDRIEGTGRHRVAGGWLLHPDWSAAQSGGGWEVRQEGRALRVNLDGPADLQTGVATRPWHPRFGVEVSTRRLTWEWEGSLPLETTTTVEPVPAGG